MITCGGGDTEKSIFEIDFEQATNIRDGFRERQGVLVHGGGETVVQRIATTDRARRELGRTVKTADVLVRRLGVTGYPRELSRVVGHLPDTRQPYLVATRRGRPLAELRDRLPLDPGQLWAVVDGIVAVLTQLADLRLVHRDIRPETLLWDGVSVQLADFGLAVHEFDERRGPTGADPWRSPEQAAGLGKADCRDDVYSAGAVIFHLATGEEASTAAEMRDRVGLLDTSLRNLLDGVFTDHARHRVSGFALRRRRAAQTGRSQGPGPGLSVPPRLAELEQQARDSFRALRTQQLAHNARPQSARPMPPARPPGTGGPPARDRATVVLAAALAVLFVLIVVVIVT